MRISSRWGLPLLAAVMMLVRAEGARAADPEKAPPPREDVHKALDDRIRKSLFDVINRGVDLYNEPNYDVAGCYHMFEGGLRAVAPLLDHHPDLQTKIADGLKGAELLPTADRRAWHLRKVLDDVRTELKTGAPVPTVAKTLWDRLGGRDGVTKIVGESLTSAVQDAKVNFFRDGKYKLDDVGGKRVIDHFVEFISSITGGPLKYTGKDMKTAHKDMAITDAEFDALAGHFKKALENNGVKADDVETVLKAVEATRKDIVSPKLSETPAAKTLWERLGGEKGVGKIVDDLYFTASKDPKVNFWRKKDAKPPTEEQVKALREKMIDYFSSLTGGPREYKGKSMKAVHAGMFISEEEFDIFARHFKDVLDANHVKPDDVKTIMTAVGTTKKDIVEEKKPDDKKPDDKKPDDKKPADKKPDDKSS
jgi:hemoglobin